MDTTTCKVRTTAKFAKLNKNCTLAEYEREVRAGEYYHETVEVREFVTMTPEQYNEFANNLLDNREWLAGKGGHGTDWDMPHEVKHWWQLNTEQKEAYRREAFAICVAVQCDGRRTLYVNPEGHGYARYLGI